MKLSAKARRLKGVAGEREVRKAFERGGYEVRGLEGEGDHLVVCRHGLTLHIESKRQETIRILLWSRQAESEAPQGTVPMVAYRPSREPWRVSMKLDDLVAILVSNSELVSAHHDVGIYDGRTVLIGDRCPICEGKA